MDTLVFSKNRGYLGLWFDVFIKMLYNSFMYSPGEKFYEGMTELTKGRQTRVFRTEDQQGTMADWILVQKPQFIDPFVTRACERLRITKDEAGFLWVKVFAEIGDLVKRCDVPISEVKEKILDFQREFIEHFANHKWYLAELLREYDQGQNLRNGAHFLETVQSSLKGRVQRLMEGDGILCTVEFPAVGGKGESFEMSMVLHPAHGPDAGTGPRRGEIAVAG